jgi:hypothetical protein
MSSFESGTEMTSNNKGIERELFINRFLAEMLPPTYRLGSGEATDREGKITGQLDHTITHKSGAFAESGGCGLCLEVPRRRSATVDQALAIPWVRLVAEMWVKVCCIVRDGE